MFYSIDLEEVKRELCDDCPLITSNVEEDGMIINDCPEDFNPDIKFDRDSGCLVCTSRQAGGY